MLKNSNNFKEILAKRLAKNHASLSVSSEDTGKMLKDESTNKEPSQRIIVVVGAGASLGAGLPLGKDAKDKLIKAFDINPNATASDNTLSGFFKYELSRLETQYKLDPDDFETNLLALSKFNPTYLREKLYDIFGYRYYPTLTYEILAHLLKHRFIDAIINFNFDELLDQAVDDELGVNNYYKVISDGDYPDEKHETTDPDEKDKIIDDNKRFSKPLYIKPHGTASHKSTLRFTREAYFLLPEDIKKLLENLLSNLPTTIIVIGFGMQSVEFNKIIEECAEKSEIEIFSIDIKPLSFDNERLRKLYENRLIEVSDNKPLAKNLEEICEKVSELFNDELKPRGIARHELISNIFFQKIDNDNRSRNRCNSNKHLKSYLKARIYVELALCISKAKGFVHLNQIANSRAGRYFELYKEETKSKSNLPSKSLLHFCEDMGFLKFDYSAETLRLPPPKKKKEANIIERTKFMNFNREKLFNKTCKSVSQQTKSKLKEHKKVFLKALEYMYDGEEVEVGNFGQINPYLLFKNPHILNTHAALKVYTQELLEKDWDLLFCIAESGQWLLRDKIPEKIKDQGKRIELIVADPNAYRKRLEEKKGFGDDLKIYQLPWWLHNQHLTLIIKNGKPISGVYFERRLRASRITPVGLEETEDCEMILNVFLSYLVKAEQYDRNEAVGIVTRKHIEEARKKILDTNISPTTQVNC